MLEWIFFLLLASGIIVLLAGLYVYSKETNGGNTIPKLGPKIVGWGIVIAIAGVLGLGFYHPFPPPG